MMLEFVNSVATQFVAIGLITTYLFVILKERYTRVKAPRIGKNPRVWGLWQARTDFVKNGRDLTKLGYEQHKDSMYWIQTGDMDRLVISNRYLDELRKLPDSYLDSKLAVVERNLGWYNGVDIILKSSAHVDVCRAQLVQNLEKVTESQISDLEDIFKVELGRCFQDRGQSYPYSLPIHATVKRFQFFNAAETILNIVNRSLAKTLVGEPLCYDNRWLQASLETTVNTGLLCRTLQKYPAALRPLLYRFTNARWNLSRSFDMAQELISDNIMHRQRGDKNIDILQWLVDSRKEEKINTSFLTNQTLFIAIASTRSTASSLINTLFDLISFPEYQSPLLQEIETVLAETGGWNLSAVQKMKRLDSFIKESQRLNHHLLLSFNRKVRRPVKLSNGVTIPPGTFISTPAYWVSRDPNIFPDGESFKPWRWYELREAAEREGRRVTPFLASSTSPDNLHWGYGRNSCPGRFMATSEIKLLVAWILRHFEISFPQGQITRPESIFVDERVIPDPKQEIGFRVRLT